jgi:hypothetical protein
LDLKVLNTKVIANRSVRSATPDLRETKGMYGLIGKMRATRGQRDAIMEVLLASTGARPAP